MWPFSLIRKLRDEIKDLKNFNSHLQEANIHLFEMWKRERSDLDANTQDCLEEYCKSIGVKYKAIRSPQEYYEWVWHELIFLELTKKSDPNTGIYRGENGGDIIEFQKSDTGNN